MRIGFDLDKVFINYPPFIPAFIFDKFYKEKDNGELKYRIPGKIDQQIRKLIHFPFLRPPIKENINFLKELSKNSDYELYLITSRYNFLEKRTLQLLKKYKFDKLFKKIFINIKNEQPHFFKDRIIKEENIEVYFDDDLSLLKHLHKENPNLILFWLSHNKNIKAQSPIKTIGKLSDSLNYR